MSFSALRRLFDRDSTQVLASGATMAGDGKQFLFIETAEGERILSQVNIADGWMDEARVKLGLPGI
ncbi:MAG: hypothetical protein JSS51_15175 [Planctomycetes bacterium]|nr:hypothetical protein [Planctomycetota bacterium]